MLSVIGEMFFPTSIRLPQFAKDDFILLSLNKIVSLAILSVNIISLRALLLILRLSECSEELVDSDKDYAGMSSFYKNVQSEKAGSHDRSITVPTLTYSDLISMCNITQVDYLKIDTEGHDYEILKMVDLRGPLRPKYIKIEHKHSSFDAIVGHLSTHGYHCEVWPWDIIAIDVLPS